ncbi:hypothetical protein HOLleu_06243 [Holothuria leucospilota]|uniref:Uncharacterized protein n=1 Tax=Holothuria leucospilota TaxID=206669 RepID=A0A9Q1CL17_HOLLE|nr:hypothetical protein HOLleu_06243 [Holothuria leucospilota]
MVWMLKLMTVLKQLRGLRKSLNGQDSKEITEKMRQARQRKLNMKVTVTDVKEAELAIVKFIQKQIFTDEIAALQDDSKGRPIKKKSFYQTVGPKI